MLLHFACCVVVVVAIFAVFILNLGLSTFSRLKACLPKVKSAVKDGNDQSSKGK